MNRAAGLGLFSLSALVVGNMIGAGVFTTSGFALQDLGSPLPVLLAWLAGGLLALSGAVSYGVLARLMPQSGGEYLFLSRTVHPLAGFIAGWISLLAGFTGAIALAALALAGEGMAAFMRAIIALALLTSVSAMIMAGPRVYARMAEDGLMPAALRFRGEVPAAAVALQALLAIVVVWVAGLRELLSYLGFTLSLSAAATVASLFVAVRRLGPDAARPAGYPWAPAIFVMATLLFAALAALHSPREMAAALVTFLLTAGLYYLVRSRTGFTGN